MTGTEKGKQMWTVWRGQSPLQGVGVTRDHWRHPTRGVTEDVLVYTAQHRDSTRELWQLVNGHRDE